MAAVSAETLEAAAAELLRRRPPCPRDFLRKWLDPSAEAWQESELAPVSAASLQEARAVIDRAAAAHGSVLVLWDIDDTLLQSAEGGPRRALTEPQSALDHALAPVTGVRHLALTAGSVDDCFAEGGMLRRWGGAFAASPFRLSLLRDGSPLVGVVGPSCRGITIRRPPAFECAGPGTLVLDQVAKGDIAEAAMRCGAFGAVVMVDNALAELDCVLPPSRPFRSQEQAEAHYTNCDPQSDDAAEVYSCAGALRCAGRPLLRVHYRRPWAVAHHKVLPGEWALSDAGYGAVLRRSAAFGRRCLALLAAGELGPLEAPPPPAAAAAAEGRYRAEKERLRGAALALAARLQEGPGSEAAAVATEWRKARKGEAGALLQGLGALQYQHSENNRCAAALFAIHRAQLSGGEGFPCEAAEELRRSAQLAEPGP